MSDQAPNYDPRYLAGILLFNAGEFFEAHEVWEELWTVSSGQERKFCQGLIQSAVGLCHFGNGNLRGAVKLYRSAQAYMKDLPCPFMGLDIAAFWERMGRCFRDLMKVESNSSGLVLDESLLPVIELKPPPQTWPDTAEFLDEQ